MGPLKEEVLAGGIPFPPDTPEAILGTTTSEFLLTSMPSSWRFFWTGPCHSTVCGILNTSDSLDVLLILWWASTSAAQQASITRSVIGDEVPWKCVRVYKYDQLIQNSRLLFPNLRTIVFGFFRLSSWIVGSVHPWFASFFYRQRGGGAHTSNACYYKVSII